MEFPELLEPVDGFLAAFTALEKSIHCASRPHSTAGCYGFDLWVNVQSGNLELGDKQEMDPFHLAIARLHDAWEKVRNNSMSESPETLSVIGVSEREFRTLKELGRFRALNVKPRLRTADGRTSELPAVDPDLLGKVRGAKPEDHEIDSVVTGVSYTADGKVMLQLGFARWVWARYVSLHEASSKLPDRPSVIGILKYVEGSYEFQGGTLTDSKQIPAPLPPV